MKFNLILFVVAVFLPVVVFAQVTLEWEARYSLTAGTDHPYAMVVDNSSNVIITGSTVSGGFGTEDFLTLKYNSSGLLQWDNPYNGGASGVDIAMAVAVDAAGNIYVTGSSASATGYYDIVTIKYSSGGYVVWVKHFNGVGGKNDIPYAITIDDSANIIVAGSSEGLTGTHGIFEDYLVLKYDSSGLLKWSKTYDGPGGDLDAAYSVDVNSAGDIVITGESGGGSVSSSDPYQDYATILYDRSGSILWINRYNGTLTNSGDKANAVKFDIFNNVIVTGTSEGILSSYDYLTVKYSYSGSLVWEKRYDGLGNTSDEAFSVATDYQGNVCVTGSTYSGITQGNNMTTVKYDLAGTMLWDVNYNGPGNGNDKGVWLEADPFLNFYVTGESVSSSTSADFVTVKYNSSGAQQWSFSYSNSATPGGFDSPVCLRLDSDNNVYVAGISSQDFATVKYSQLVGIDPVENNSRIKIYPNPGNGKYFISGFDENVRMEIYHASGRLVYKSFSFSENTLIDLSDIACGVYFVTISSEKYSETRRVVLRKNN
jgi:hypothetical protein